MAWVAGAIVLVFLLWRFTKVTLIASGVLAVGTAAVFAVMIFNEERGRSARSAEKEKIDLVISASTKQCLDPAYPLWIGTVNRNDFSIDSVTVSVFATAPGFSSKLYEDYLTSDRILKPGDGYGACWRLSDYKLTDGKIAGKVAGELEWSGSVSSISKSN